MTKKHWLRAAEFSLLVLVWYGVVESSRHIPRSAWGNVEREEYDEYLRKNGVLEHCQRDWFELLLLLAVAVSLIVLRPLTTPNASMRQRYAVVGFILGAGLVWYSFILGVIREDRGLDPIWVLLIVALLASAGYLRIGWPRSGAQRVPIGNSGPEILASTDDGDKRGGGTGE